MKRGFRLPRFQPKKPEMNETLAKDPQMGRRYKQKVCSLCGKRRTLNEAGRCLSCQMIFKLGEREARKVYLEPIIEIMSAIRYDQEPNGQLLFDLGL